MHDPEALQNLNKLRQILIEKRRGNVKQMVSSEDGWSDHVMQRYLDIQNQLASVDAAILDELRPPRIGTIDDDDD